MNAKETIRICQSESVLKEYLKREREEVIDMMLALFDEETLMKNHDATIERKIRKEITDLLIYLRENNREDDANKALEDADYLDKLLKDYRSLKASTNQPFET